MVYTETVYLIVFYKILNIVDPQFEDGIHLISIQSSRVIGDWREYILARIVWLSKIQSQRNEIIEQYFLVLYASLYIFHMYLHPSRAKHYT